MATVPTTSTPAEATNNLLAIWRTLRANAVQYIAACNAGSLDSYGVAMWLTKTLATYKTLIATYKAVSGVGADLAARFPEKFANEAAATAAIADFETAHNALIVWLENNIPQDASKRLSVLVLAANGSGTVTPRMITAQASRDAFRVQLETLRDATDA